MEIDTFSGSGGQSDGSARKRHLLMEAEAVKTRSEVAKAVKKKTFKAEAEKI